MILPVQLSIVMIFLKSSDCFNKQRSINIYNEQKTACNFCHASLNGHTSCASKAHCNLQAYYSEDYINMHSSDWF